MIVFKFVFFLVLLFRLGDTLECYRCSGSSRQAGKADKACHYGYSLLEKQQCPQDHVCTTYQYEISIYGLIRSIVTLRGCQHYERAEDCDNLLEEMRSLVHPAKVREINCHSCPDNFCNS